MKAIILLVLSTAFWSGCVSHSPAAADPFAQKRPEIQVLREELAVVTANLDRLHRELAIQGGYPTEAQARDLDYFISVLRDARDKLAAEDKRIHQQYHVGYGSY